MYPGKGGVTTNPTKAFLNNILSHPATTHALLLVSTLAYRRYVADSGFGVTQYHRNMVGAVRSINKSLDDPTQRFSDSVVGAITLLVRNEVSLYQQSCQLEDIKRLLY
jgi:hypothetical protein